VPGGSFIVQRGEEVGSFRISARRHSTFTASTAAFAERGIIIGLFLPKIID
jgi:hypothetical protein